VVTVAVAPG